MVVLSVTSCQVLAANHLLENVEPFVPVSRPAIGIVYSQATEQVDLIGSLRNPSSVALVPVSELILKTARSLLAPAIGRRHSLSEQIATPGARIDTGAADLVICDTIAMSMVRSRNDGSQRTP